MSTSQPNGETTTVVLTENALDTLRYAQLKQTRETVADLVEQLEQLDQPSAWLASFAHTLLAANEVAGVPSGGALHAANEIAPSVTTADVAPMEATLVRDDLREVQERLSERSDLPAHDAITTLQMVTEDLDALDAIGWP